ncbi:hypothetical protein [Burkholderia sp. BCC0405]|uniref:hypothetical protein n=1 Tax=Burkholderia sp. BCC0405 TaxID=2676298 RepID=UPI00158F2179|nr:hypothetical protein [Burkholderia sp. BCC0405]
MQTIALTEDIGTAKEERLELDGVVDVRPELSVYDLTEGRINFRHRDDQAPTASTGKQFVRR